MIRHPGLMRCALFALCLTWSACLPFDEDRDAFCANVDPGRLEELCPSVPAPAGGASTDAGASVDAGVDAGPEEDAGIAEDAGVDGGAVGECVTAEDCPERPATCQNFRVCVDQRCEYRQQEDGAPCSGMPTAQCRESTGTCRSGVCEYPPRAAGPCDDGQSCTINDVCHSGGVCSGTLLDCSNAPVCMKFAGTCSNNQCNYVLLASGTACDDGKQCTVNDVCRSDGSCSGTLLDCSSPPVCKKFAGTCSNSQCDYEPAASGTACDDNNMCTFRSTCDGSGKCVGTEQVYCEDTPEACIWSTGCDPNRGCTYSSSCQYPKQCMDGVCCQPPHCP